MASQYTATSTSRLPVVGGVVLVATLLLVGMVSPASSIGARAPQTAEQPRAASDLPASALGDTGVLRRFPTEEVFVDQIYRDFLSRGPDSSGLAFWSGRLRSGSSPEVLVEDLLNSSEFAGTTAPIVRLYRAIFGRLPDLEGLRFWVGRRASGVSLETIASQFLLGAEFDALAGADSTTEVVGAVYGRTLGRIPDPEGLAFWIGEVDSGRLSLAQFIVLVSESPEHLSLRHGEVVTTLVFLGLLQRLPEPAGLDFWEEQVRGGLPIRLFAGAVMSLPEYQSRFPLLPQIQTEVVASDLRIPWDIESLPDGSLVVTERPGGLVRIQPDGSAIQVNLDLSDLYVSGETGMMGLAIDPDFTDNRRIYTCQGHQEPREIQVIAWTFDSTLTQVSRVQDPLVGGLPLQTGRHGGCQLEFGSDGFLFIGTGDSASGSEPQDLTSLGGKVLRVDPLTGLAPPSNPFAGSTDPNTRLVYSYGHRNVQGLGLRPSSGDMWSVEHGPDRDDEVNRLVPGGNAGWDPVPGYNERVPMTNLGLANAYPAAFSTGAPALALSGGDWVNDRAWGPLNGALGVAALKNQTLRFLFFNGEGLYLGQRLILDGEFGRLRAVHQSPDGSVYVSTSTGNDRVVRLTPIDAP